MVVCPLGVVSHWEKEFKLWLPGETFKSLNVSEVNSCKNKKERRKIFERWRQLGGIMIIEYELFRSLTKEVKNRSEQDLFYYQSLVNPGPDVLFGGIILN